MPKSSTKPTARKLVLSRETVRTLNEPVSAEDGVTGCNCYSRCTCTTDLC